MLAMGMELYGDKMSTLDPYKCEDHKIDLVCSGCVKAWIARHDKMLEFIEKIAFYPNEFEELSHASCDATEILKEIGKLR